MGFEDHETHDLYSNVAGIMHMGEMKFKQRPREEQAEPDGEEGLSIFPTFFISSHSNIACVINVVSFLRVLIANLRHLKFKFQFWKR